jgi:type IV pilus assembly protein PilB
MALSKQLGIPYVDIKNYAINPSVVKLLPVELAQKHQSIPINRVMEALTLAMVDPLGIASVDEIKRSCRLTVRPVFATPTGIKDAIRKYYGVKEDVSTIVVTVSPGGSVETPFQEAVEPAPEEVNTLVKEAAQAPVVTLVNSMIAQAVEAGASDIHLEPEEKTLYVRFRIDGILQDNNQVSKDLEPAVLSRIKIMAEMDIAEKRLPQDGRIKLNVMDHEVDLRVSTLPTIYGENIVIRILDKSQALFRLEDLGFNPLVLATFKDILHRPYGIILVTGPTGSGKTTTLYGALNLINDVTKNILTMEDPIEYVIPRVRQTQVNVKAGLTFATGLRATLRHDPDIIMIGEIRDRETAEIAIQAALTGHLVFSTLHTNDAASAVTRLIDMGVEPFLVASSLLGIMAQRLARRLCMKCRKPYQPIDEELLTLGFKSSRVPEAEFYKEAGCPACRQTGYKGRIGMYELLIPTESFKELVLKKSPPHQIRDYAVSKGMITLRDDGLDKFRQGVISASEIVRITMDV